MVVCPEGTGLKVPDAAMVRLATWVPSTRTTMMSLGSLWCVSIREHIVDVRVEAVSYFEAYTNVLEMPEYPSANTTSSARVTASNEFAPQAFNPAALLSVERLFEGEFDCAPVTFPVVRIVPPCMPQGPIKNVPEQLSAPWNVWLRRSSGFPGTKAPVGPKAHWPSTRGMFEAPIKSMACAQTVGRRADVARRAWDRIVKLGGDGLERVKTLYEILMVELDTSREKMIRHKE